MQVTAPLDPIPASAGDARRLVTRTLADWGLPDLADDAALVTSELVSNAVRHGHPPLRIEVTRRRSSLRIAVRDCRPERLPLMRGPSADGSAGRGLLVVGHLAGAWGWDRDDDGKLVWADLDCPPAGQPA